MRAQRPPLTPLTLALEEGEREFDAAAELVPDAETVADARRRLGTLLLDGLRETLGDLELLMLAVTVREREVELLLLFEAEGESVKPTRPRARS